jgi:hypothetical protein
MREEVVSDIKVSAQGKQMRCPWIYACLLFVNIIDNHPGYWCMLRWMHTRICSARLMLEPSPIVLTAREIPKAGENSHVAAGNRWNELCLLKCSCAQVRRRVCTAGTAVAVPKDPFAEVATNVAAADLPGSATHMKG